MLAVVASRLVVDARAQRNIGVGGDGRSRDNCRRHG